MDFSEGDRLVNALRQRVPPRYDNRSAFPEKFRGTIDFRRETFVHWTIQRSLFQHLAVRRIRWKRNVNFRGKPNDPARPLAGHFLLHCHGHSAQIDTKFLRLDSHGGTHASSQSRRDEISRRERFTFAFIIGGCVG